MLENPQYLVEMVHKSGAHSTDIQSPESVEHLCSTCVEYAKHWAATAKEERQRLEKRNRNNRIEIDIYSKFLAKKSPK